MKDLHSHYMPAIDDGSRSKEMTKAMLALAKEYQITSILFTPHYIVDSRYMSSSIHNKILFLDIKKEADALGISIYLGNEVYLNRDIPTLLEKGEITTLNGSRYLLIEIPMHSKINDVKSIFFDLINRGIRPILAHPERYSAYYKDLEFFASLQTMGVLMQLNITSLVGNYGRREKKMAKLLLQNHMISFVGSDFHSSNREKYELLPKALKKLKKIVGEEEFIALTETNFEKVIKDEEIIMKF